MKIKEFGFHTLCCLDKTCDYVPILSLLSNIINGVVKKTLIKNIDQSKLNANAYYSHLKNKNIRCIVAAIPIAGNLGCGLYDIYQTIKFIASNLIKHIIRANENVAIIHRGGIVNQSNSCFIAAVFQMIANDPYIITFFDPGAHHIDIAHQKYEHAVECQNEIHQIINKILNGEEVDNIQQIRNKLIDNLDFDIGKPEGGSVAAFYAQLIETFNLPIGYKIKIESCVFPNDADLSKTVEFMKEEEELHYCDLFLNTLEKKSQTNKFNHADLFENRYHIKQAAQTIERMPQSDEELEQNQRRPLEYSCVIQKSLCCVDEHMPLMVMLSKPPHNRLENWDDYLAQYSSEIPILWTPTNNGPSYRLETVVISEGWHAYTYIRQGNGDYDFLCMNDDNQLVHSEDTIRRNFSHHAAILCYKPINTIH